MAMSIGQLAKQANVSNRTLRYYEELGLITPKMRGENRYRYYDESHLLRLNTIKMLQDAGFALKEIVSAYAPILDPQGHVTYTGQEAARRIFNALKEQREKLAEKQKELNKVTEEITATMNQLSTCFGCTISHKIEECASCPKGPHEVRNLGRHHGHDHDAEALSAADVMMKENSK